jgi:hypothetical protein
MKSFELKYNAPYLEMVLWKLYIFFLIFSPLGNNILSNYSLPPVITLFRESILLLIMFMCRHKLKKKKFIILISVILFSAIYLIIGLLQGLLSETLYFLRVYSEPLFVFFFASIYFAKDNTLVFIRYILKLGIVASIVSFIGWVTFYTNPDINIIFHGGLIPWKFNFIEKQGIYRASFPVGGPNSQGLLMAILVILTFITPYKRKVYKVVSVIIVLAGLIITFSKSSFMVVVIFFFIYSFYSLKVRSGILKFIFYSFLVMVVLFWFNDVSVDEVILKWINSSFTMRDTSNQGHLNSLMRAMDQFDDYMLFGYPKGTVGPKSLELSQESYSVESSFFIILFDMGVFFSVFYFLPIYVILKAHSQSKLLYIFFFAITFQYLVLPSIQNIEITSIVFIVTSILSNYFVIQKGGFRLMST